MEKAFDCVPHGILWEVLWEYGVHGPLLSAVRSLYNRSRSLVCIASCKSDLFPVHVGLRQGCPLSPVLFIVFMDRISRHSQGLEGVRFGDHRISSLIFADDVVLLAPSSLDLQHALGCFAAECDVAGMRVSTSKLAAMVLNRKKVACTLQVGGKVLPQVEEFKYLEVLFTSEGRMDREIDRHIGAAAAVMRSMYRSVVVKKELSRKAKLSIYQSIYVPTLTYGHELWVMTERVRSRIQAAEMSFLRRVAGRSLRDRVRSSVTREELGVEPLLLHIERGLLRWLGHLFQMPPGRLPGEVFQACPTGKRPRGRPRKRWRDYVSWLAWERLGVPTEELEEVSGEREMANIVTSVCYVVLAAVVVVYAQRRGQQASYVRILFCFFGTVPIRETASLHEQTSGVSSTNPRCCSIVNPIPISLESRNMIVGFLCEAEGKCDSLTLGITPMAPLGGGRIQYARIGSNVTMQCGSLDSDASVTWKVNGTDVKAKRREEGPRLILLEVDMSSNGLYSCFQNPDGQRRDQITFRIGHPLGFWRMGQPM
ncbi:hypothetical protein QTP70_004353 [Hemibagrus guttatus]|uniref:Reverse transcriptase n=1 Tax=Hemibagrus guttatus TaxID=175788 RepID=A0AAE0QHQ5_9TELE|nr:hypothetical protein QTP70_004353 [Hemibagrus guttatus]